MDEHSALVGQAHLERHVQREEDGIFRAMRTTGEFLEEIDELEGEHRGLAAAIAVLDPDSPDFPARVTRLLDDLAVHVERQDAPSPSPS